MFRINARGRRVLLIPDTHIPYHHVDAFRFVRAIWRKFVAPYKGLAVHLGDENDKHALSFHDSDPDLDSAGKELKMAKKSIHCRRGLHETFPRLHLLESNHGSLHYRKAKAHGIPIAYIRTLQEILETPRWLWHHEILLKTHLGEVYLCHGKVARYNAMAKDVGCSAIQGHFHGKFEVTWYQSAKGDRFNMFCGALINWEALAFAYARNNLPKPILGAGILDERGYPWPIKMDLDKNNRWTGKLPNL